MNNYKVKAIRAIKRLAAIAKKQTQRKSSQSSTSSQLTQPCINNLYSIDFAQAGSVIKNVVARYAGKSKSGKFLNFQPLTLCNAQGIRIHLLCLNELPLKLKRLKQDLFSSKAA